MPWLYGATVLLSAVLLFWVEPLVAKMLLPLLGGTPAVWNTSLVFFQAMLLAGYAYAHWTTRWLGLRRQACLHLTLLVAGLCVLPIAIPIRLANAPTATTHPALWVLGALTVIVGLPFFALAASGPLLQKWFAASGHPAGVDPYFLYSASNAGSLLALLAYPTALEPALRLGEQSRWWTLGFLLLITCFVFCAGAVWRANPSGAPPAPAPATAQAGGALGWRRKGLWLVLAFVPSSLMLGVTTYISTDLAAVALLWVIPLAVYLLTFILAFSRRQWLPRGVAARALPVGMVGLVFLFLSRATEPFLVLTAFHLGFLFLAAWFCHGWLAADRPAPVYLTEFYLWVSAGGVLGGVFNALLAPNLFRTVLEYPLGIAAVGLLHACSTGRGGANAPVAGGARPAAKLEPAAATAHPGPRRPRLSDLLAAAILGVGTALLAHWAEPKTAWAVQGRNALVFGLPLVVAYLLVTRPWRFYAALAAIALGSLAAPDPRGRTLYVERDFFGVSRVRLDPNGASRCLVHGNTVHGRQFLAPMLQCVPTAYYHRGGPAARIMELAQRLPSPRHIAVVGLGTGALVTYSRPDDAWTYYEIDPAVVGIAQNTNYFTYLHHCAPGGLKIVLGDARLRLRAAPPHGYGLLVLDAFSSDAIPVHLLTREALDLYLTKLTPDGLLAFHISNRSLNLEPVLGDLAGATGLVCYGRHDLAVSTSEAQEGDEPSHWLIMARLPQVLEPLRHDPLWHRVLPRHGRAVWTDDFSNLLGAFAWRSN